MVLSILCSLDPAQRKALDKGIKSPRVLPIIVGPLGASKIHGANSAGGITLEFQFGILVPSDFARCQSYARDWSIVRSLKAGDILDVEGQAEWSQSQRGSFRCEQGYSPPIFLLNMARVSGYFSKG